MAICLKVEKYCNNCRNFVPKAKFWYTDGTLYSTEIICDNAFKCREIAENIKKYFKEEKDKEGD